MYTLKDIAGIRGCSKQAVWTLAKRKRVLGKRLGKMLYFSAYEVKRLGMTLPATGVSVNEIV